MAKPRIVNGEIRASCSYCRQEFSQDQMLAQLTYCKPCWRAYMRFKRYGITAEEYAERCSKQRNVCAICEHPNVVPRKNSTVNNLAVDHDRITGKVRGLLCGLCNRGIGYMRHDPKLLSRAARYLVGWSQ